MPIPLGNHELATTLWSLQQALCYIMLWCFIWASAQVQSNRVFWALDTSLLLLTTSHIFQCNPPSFDDFDLDNKHLPRDLGSFMAFLGQLMCLHFRAFLWQCSHVDDGTMWIFHLGSQFLLCSTESCRPSGSKLNFSCWVDTGQNHIFQTWIQVCDSSSTCSACSKEVWNFTKICSFVPSTKLASGNSACKASFNTPASMNKTASRDAFVSSP